MNIAFMGGIFPKEFESDIINNCKGMIDFAANNLQWNIISGLDRCSNTPVYLCNVMLIRSFPKGYKKAIIKTQRFSHRPGSNDTNLGFINIAGISMISRLFSATKGLLRWAYNNHGDNVIITYGIHTPYLLASTLTRSCYSSTKSCLVVPDLPEFMSESKNIVYRFLKSIDRAILNFCMKRVDAFVLLCETMNEKVNLKGRPWILMEGIYQSATKPDSDLEIKKTKAILYTGTLKKQYGIMNLLAAFESIEDNEIELWICGDGDMRGEVEKSALRDPRIKYFGQLPRENIFAMQREAAILINPRTSSGEFTRYSFPSKIMEYMASGTPVLMHKLDGIPEEYYKYCFVAGQENSDSLKVAIMDILEKDPESLKQIGKNAQKFILEQKTPEKQILKVIKLIEKILSDG